MKRLLSLSAAALAFGLVGCQSAPGPLASFSLQATGADTAKRFGLMAHFSEQACFGQPYAVFASDAKDNFQISGSTNKIQGDVHTNDVLKVSGNNNQITGVAEAAHGFDLKGKAGAGIPNQQAAGQEAQPLVEDPNAFVPTFSFQGDVDLRSVASVWARPGVLRTGVYKSTGKISLSGNGAQGQVTFVAAQVHISGQSNQLTPFQGGVLFLATGTGNNVIHISGNSNALAGLLDAPNGEFQLSGHQNAIQGMVEAKEAKISGSQNNIVFQDFGYCPPPAPTPAPSTTASPSAAPGPSLAPSTDPAGGPTPPPADGNPTDPTPSSTATPVNPTPPPASGSTWDFPGGGKPFAILLDQGQNVWTTDVGSFVDVTKVDTTTQTTTRQVVGTNAHFMALEAATQRVWVTVFDDGLVHCLTPNATPAFDQPFRMPTGIEGIAFNANQDPVACGWGTGMLYKLDAANGTNFTVAHDFHSTTCHPRGIVYDGAGNAWVALNGCSQVVRVAPNGTESRVSTNAHPSQLTIDHNGKVWVTCTGTDVDALGPGEQPGHTVMCIDPATMGTTTVEVGQSPYGITTDANGNILVVNTVSATMTKLSPAGQTLATYPLGASDSWPVNVAMDRQGFAWVTQYAGNKLVKIFP